MHKESLALHRDLGERAGVASSLSYLGAVAAGSASIGLKRTKNGPQELPGQLERAATLFGAVDSLLESMTAVLNGDDRQFYVRTWQLCGPR